MTARCVMVLGTSSGAGKSWIATALCRYYADQGLKVAPFKAQNMSNNARVVAASDGRMGEIGSAQYFQALAARAVPDVRMNPLLLKPEADTRSQVVLMGQVSRELSALPWRGRSERVWPQIAAALDALRAENDVIVIEGAGSPAEINLMASDVVNLRVARHAGARCLLVTDIDRGGAFAHLYGTWALVAPEDRARIAGFVLNKFRGDAALLAPAPEQLEQLTGVPTVAVVPMRFGHGLPEEDGVFDDRAVLAPSPAGGGQGWGQPGPTANASPLTPAFSPEGRGSHTAAPDLLPLPPAGEGRGEGAASPKRDTTPYQMRVDDNILPNLLPKLELLAQYRRRQAAVSAWNSKNRHLKRGIAITPVKFGISFTATLFNQAGALVHVYTDGSVQVNHGGTEMGQGLHTKVAQVVADELGVPLPQVLVTGSATDKVPNASATAASSGTDLNGKAAQAAARTVRDNLAAFVCGLDGCGAGAVEFRGGQVITPKTTRAFADVVKDAYANRIQLWSDGFYRTPKIHYDKTTLTGRPFFYFAYGAACSEVAIDTLTGEYRVLGVDILHDVGRSINPAIDIGQIEGGFIQGMGWLTTEELVWDDKGQLTTKAPSTYKIPTGADLPPHFNVHLWPEPNDEDTIFRSKAVGEPPFMLAISVWEALRNAVAAAREGATADARAPVRMDAPATPERVLRALGTVPLSDAGPVVVPVPT